MQYNRIPVELQRQTDALTRHLSGWLGGASVGVYVHGSICLGDYIPGRSDLDVLIVTDRRLATGERAEFARYLLTIHNRPAPIELSIVYTGHLRPWQHPTPCQFHFSEYWRERYTRFLAEGDFSSPLLSTDFTDSDIACHAALTRQSGICLAGRPACDVLPEVPIGDFWDSIAGELETFQFTDYGPQYLASNILTLCRIWSFARLRRILTKRAAGLWAAPLLPDACANAVTAAVSSRCEGAVLPDISGDTLDCLRTELARHIREDAPSLP